MNTLELLRTNLDLAHDAFSKTVADVTQEMADWLPPGIMHPIGERYAHLVMAEDMLLHSFAKDSAPLFAGEWAGRTGFAADMQMLLGQTSEQARAFRVDDLNALAEYMRAVFADTQAFINDAPEEILTTNIDMSVAGYGTVPFPVWFSSFIIGHIHDLTGEISALKGCLGVKGYPF